MYVRGVYVYVRVVYVFVRVVYVYVRGVYMYVILHCYMLPAFGYLDRHSNNIPG